MVAAIALVGCATAGVVKMNRPRALIIGKSGQVAQALLEILPQHGFEVAQLGRPELDLTHMDAALPLIAALKPNLMINAAAYTAVDKAETDVQAAFAVNAQGAQALAHIAAQLGIPLIHFSTDYVFNGQKGAPYSEEDATNPLGVYGTSKLAGEQLIAAATPNHVILRTSWVCSAGGANFMNTMLKLAQTRSELNVVDDQHGAPTFADDLAIAVAQIAKNLLAQPDATNLRGIFHCTGAGETTWCGFAKAIFVAKGLHVQVNAIPTAAYPTPARRPQDSRLDCEKLARIHGVHMPQWHVALARVVHEV